ncbi:acylamino acid-releasing protein [Bremerella cremea]|uniref:Acylamino acid-releasing protein n=1 Tax=Bremerella cremea TaxID=1031537 RepID=A0A368KXC1_9BACT|nr:alpha/beta fold hydrolase [Bremerella cremea]RCS54297.1 acylamino acid-releasing protein [Bremerella cremea]
MHATDLLRRIIRDTSLLFGCWLLISSSVFAEDVIQRSANLPKTQPWDLAKLSVAPKFTWIDQKSPVRSLTYVGENYQGHPTSVFAYYATPGSIMGDESLDKDLPAVVLIHGGGGTAFREWAELWAKRGYAAIAMDLAGARPIEGQNPHDHKNRTRLPDGGPNQTDQEKFQAIDQPVTEQWQYHAVANAILAHSLILSFPEVDAERSAVTGISWGGYLTCIVAGVDTRFDAAVPVYGCGYLLDNSVWLIQFAAMSPEQRKRWQTLWEPSQYLPAVEMPILMVNGTNDFAYPLDSYMKSYHAVPVAADKQLAITVKMPHGHTVGWAPPVIGRFIDQHLRKSETLPKLALPIVNGENVQLEIIAGKPTQAAIHWTADAKPVNQHEWQSREATLHAGKVIAPKPPEDAKIWFMTVTTEDGSTISSEIVLADSANN